MISKKRQVLILIAMTISLSWSTTLAQQTTTPDSLQLNLNSHPYLEISSEQQLRSTADEEGWDGDGTKYHPYVIEGYSFEGDVDSSLASSIIENAKATRPLGFQQFSLVISNIDSYLIIRNNQFSHALLVNTSQQYDSVNVEGLQPQVMIQNNGWITSDDPSNLIVYGFGTHIELNRFDGSKMECESPPKNNVLFYKYYPRVYFMGTGATIQKNIFEVDQGCAPLVDLLLYNPPNLSPSPSPITIVRDNHFKASDLAIYTLLNEANIIRNDFDTGEIGIIQDYTVTITENNFRISSLGHVGLQNYNGTIDYVGNSVPFNTPSPIYEQFDHNYYKNYTSPDADQDGIVDYRLLLANGIEDQTPSTTPFSTYFFPVEEQRNLLEDVAVAVVILTTLFGVSYFYIAPWISKQRKIYKGALIGNTKDIIADLFASQTILYYTLIGQSKIDNKEVEEKISQAIPTEIYDFKYLLHPVRMSIVKLLYENLEMTSIEIKEIMRVSWNDYSTHSASLKKHGYIHIEEGFVDGKRRQLLTILPKGTEEFKAMMDLMHLFFDNSVDYAAYIKTAQQKLETSDPDLYPDT